MTYIEHYNNIKLITLNRYRILKLHNIILHTELLRSYIL